MKVVAISGSTRKDSFNTRLLRTVTEAVARHGAQVREIVLRDHPLPLYDGDLEASEGLPANAAWIREEIESADVLLIATPEYNGSISAVLKNVIDWVSRPRGDEPPAVIFRGKRAAIMSASPSPYGGARALGHLEFILSALGTQIIGEKLTVAQAHAALTESTPPPDLAARVENLAQAVTSSAAPALQAG